MSDITTAGVTFLLQAAIQEAGTTYFTSGVNAALGVGDSSTAYSAAQTDLQASTNKLRRVATVTRATNVLTFTSVFGSTDAVWTWNEIGIFNNPTSGGTMLARQVPSPSLGSKPSGQTWTLVITATGAAA
jgi:hypothetical protein